MCFYAISQAIVTFCNISLAVPALDWQAMKSCFLVVLYNVEPAHEELLLAFDAPVKLGGSYDRKPLLNVIL